MRVRLVLPRKKVRIMAGGIVANNRDG